MKALKIFLPNFSISLTIALLIVVYLDLRNPMMGFLVGTPFLVLIGLNAVAAIASAVVLCIELINKERVSNSSESEEQYR